jgi:thiol-disulfide isomerase/thioredoxin
MNRIVTCLVVAVIFSCAAGLIRAQGSGKVTPATVPAAKQPKVIGLMFYADWCGSCKTLDPKLQAVKKEFVDQPILFTRLDLTDDATKHQAALLAGLTGLDAIYAEHAGKTGFMLLIDAKDRKILGKLVKTQSEDELKAEIKKALGS